MYVRIIRQTVAAQTVVWVGQLPDTLVPHKGEYLEIAIKTGVVDKFAVLQRNLRSNPSTDARGSVFVSDYHIELTVE